MPRTTKKKKLKIKFPSLLMIFSIVASFFFIYQIWLLGPIEKMIRYFLIGVFLLIDILIIFRNQRYLSGKKKNVKLFSSLMILFIVLNIGAGCVVERVYSSLNSINKSKITYTANLITMANNSTSKIENIKNSKIGILSDDTAIEGSIIAKEMIEDYHLDKQNEIKKYEDVSGMIHDLYQGEISYIFVSDNYVSMFRGIEEYENIESDTKVLASKDKTLKKEDSKSEFVYSSGKDLTKPFSILLMGVDSEKDGLDKNAVAHGDSLILITFNPQTLNATMLTVTRDSYVPIQCFKDKRENKITHAAWYGTTCMINTIQSFLDVNIDYYIKINFKGAVQLVDALGGVDVEVPANLCTDSSDRTGKVCIKKGWQHLNGEEALVLARNRYDLPNGDLDRGQNQQKLLQAMINKLKTITNPAKFDKALQVISHNLDTNLSTNQILSFYNIGKDILERSGNQSEDMFNIEHLYLQGEGQMIYDQNLKLTLWNYIPNKQSVKDISSEMKRNLELEEPKSTKSFAYKIGENYTISVVGKGPYKTTTKYELLPSLLGKTQSYIEEWARKNNVKVTFKEVIDNSNDSDSGVAIKQNYVARSRLDEIRTLEIQILKKTSTPPPSEDKDCSDEENTSSICYLPNFIGKTKEEVENWNKKLESKIEISYEIVSVAAYPNAKIGTVVAQSKPFKTHLSKIKKLELTIVTEENE